MTDDASPNAMAIDIVSDVVCPWCYVGKRKIEAVLAARADTAIEIRWRPFELDPTIPPDGFDRRAYMEKKFGSAQIAAIHARLTAVGRESGLEFDFDRIERRPNTFDAHRLIRLAATQGVQTAMVERLFKAYFVEGLDIGARGVLVELANDAGLARETVDMLFAHNDDAPLVRQEMDMIRQLGINGVPLFLFADDIAISGAQSVAVLAAALEQASQRQTAA